MPEVTPRTITRSGKSRGGFSTGKGGGISKKGLPVPADTVLELSHIWYAIKTIMSGHTFTTADAEIWGWSVLFCFVGGHWNLLQFSDVSCLSMRSRGSSIKPVICWSSSEKTTIRSSIRLYD